jgi:hypothetical protein
MCFQYTYHSSYCEQLDIAFDAYLDILQCIKVDVNVALVHDTPNWRALNACPSCNYEVCSVILAPLQ